MTTITVDKTIDITVDVEVTFEQIVAALPSSLDDLNEEGLPYKFDLISGLDSIYSFVEALKPEYFSALKPEGRKILAKAFRELAAKVEPEVQGD